MKTITLFEANDGSRWDTLEKAESREGLVRQIKAVMAPLGAPLDTCDFSNGSGFIQHDPKTLEAVKTTLIELSLPMLPEGWVERQTTPLVEIHASWYARFIDDNGPVSSAWNRFYCIDNLAREWGQPYYALNSDKGDQICLLDYSTVAA